MARPPSIAEHSPEKASVSGHVSGNSDNAGRLEGDPHSSPLCLPTETAMPAAKELVEHIRLIQFSLIIACVGLFIAIWIISDSRLTEAKADLQWLCTADFD